MGRERVGRDRCKHRGAGGESRVEKKDRGCEERKRAGR